MLEIEEEQEKEENQAPKYTIDGAPIPPSPWETDKQQFITRAQPDLELAYTLIQQSQEIALKAKICAVSPVSPAFRVGCAHVAQTRCGLHPVSHSRRI